jgi:pimeloyl-ACP methyl ester carboxylesterase
MPSLRFTKRHLRGALLGLAVLVPAGITSSVATASAAPPAKPTIVIEHGAWADASSFSGVITRLQKAGYTVDVPPNPLRGPKTDVPYLASFLTTVTGPIVLVGHSYGGFVTSDAATGNANVRALVYIDAFIPAKGETINAINKMKVSSTSQLLPSVLSFVPEPGGVPDVYVKPAAFRSVMANDLPPAQAAELASTQSPLAASALAEPSTAPAWTTIPSWDLIGTEDHAIPEAAQLFMARRAHATITEVKASHLSMISQPAKVTAVIEAAAAKSS